MCVSIAQCSLEGHRKFMRDHEVGASQGSATYISFPACSQGHLINPDKPMPCLVCSHSWLVHRVRHHELPEAPLWSHGNAHSKSLQWAQTKGPKKAHGCKKSSGTCQSVPWSSPDPLPWTGHFLPFAWSSASPAGSEKYVKQGEQN